MEFRRNSPEAADNIYEVDTAKRVRVSSYNPDMVRNVQGEQSQEVDTVNYEEGIKRPAELSPSFGRSLPGRSEL